MFLIYYSLSPPPILVLQVKQLQTASLTHQVRFSSTRLLQLEATFVGVGPIVDVPKETSWTSQVRIHNPKGTRLQPWEMLSCLILD